ncbi:MAG: ATP-binding protein [Candidatus Buchananbacteria bacterium]|nr:ATP-binding protein [Candidatus Buchananbacteria bacterium]
MKLFTQLVTLFIGLTLIPLIFVGLLTYANTKGVITDQIMAQLVSIADIKKNQMNQVIDAYLADVEELALRNYLRLNLEEYNQNPTIELASSIEANIFDSLISSPEIVSIAIKDSKGKTVASVGDDYVEPLVNTKQSPAIENIFMNSQGIPRVLLRSPIIVNNSTIGSVEVVSKIDPFRIIAGDYSGLGQSGEVLIAKKNEAGDALFLTPIRFDQGAALKRIVKKDRTDVPSTHAVSGEEAFFLSGMVDYRGVPVLAVTRFIDRQGWGIVVKIDRDEVFQPLTSILLTFIVIITTTLLAVVLVAVFVARAITKPISQLSQAAGKLSQGNFTAAIEIISYYPSNEIGVMAKAFTKMASQLKELYRNLEAKVKERTHDLEKFELAVDSAYDQIVITNPDGLILHANKSIERITGFKLKEVLGRKVGSRELWGGQMGPDFYKKLWKTIKIDKKTFSGELINHRKNGDNYNVLVRISPVLDDKNRVVYFVGIERDITKEKEVDKMKTEFVSVASHQLRTPLTAIRWYVEEVYNGELGKLNKNQKDYLKQILESNERMIRLVNDLLNVSRLESGRVTVEPVLTDLVELIGTVVNECGILAKAKNCQLNFIKPKSKISKIKIDPVLIAQVINNLVSNSLKYSKSSGEKCSVVIDLSKKDPNVIISVKDNGIGIPSGLQNRVFDKFFRADNAIKSETEGTGLGLYISKMVVEASGGKIWFESSEDGTTFTFTLPLSGSPARKGEKGLS